MKNFLNKIKVCIVKHRVISVIVLIVISLIFYWGYNKLTSTVGETQYITTTVQKGTMISSITASGQVESSNQIDLTSKVSGTVTYVGVKTGDKVKKGSVLFSIDNKDAQKAVRDAEISLESANLALEKLKIQNSNENMDASSVKVYDDGFNAVSDTFYDLNSVLTGLDNMLAQNNLSDNAARMSGNTAQAKRDKAEIAYYKTENAFNQNTKNYEKLNNNSPRTDIENIIKETYDTTKLLSDAIKSATDFVDYIANDSNNPSNFTSNQTTLSTYTSTVNGHLSALLSAKTDINDNKDSSQNSSLDIKSSQLSVEQKKNSLQDAKDNLADYYVHAPFDGVVASVDINVGDTVSGTLGSIITNQKMATLSMNEVDVAKIKLGQKATITFDAIEDLSMTGSVAEIDTLGTVSSGVVSYSVKISFDTENDQIKPGMSVSASIITDSKTDTLIIPSSAIKTKGTTKYVQMFTTPLATPAAGAKGTPSSVAPNQVTVEIGISDDTNTEIISGLKEGDQIVSSTITSSTTATTTSTKSLLSGGGPM